MRTDAELKELAMDIYKERVFGTWMIREEDQPRMIISIFMVMIFMSKKDSRAMKKEGVVHLYEYMEKGQYQA